jgi:hypothetical protein
LPENPLALAMGSVKNTAAKKLLIFKRRRPPGLTDDVLMMKEQILSRNHLKVWIFTLADGRLSALLQKRRINTDYE